WCSRTTATPMPCALRTTRHMACPAQCSATIRSGSTESSRGCAPGRSTSTAASGTPATHRSAATSNQGSAVRWALRVSRSTSKPSSSPRPSPNRRRKDNQNGAVRRQGRDRHRIRRRHRPGVRGGTGPRGRRGRGGRHQRRGCRGSGQADRCRRRHGVPHCGRRLGSGLGQGHGRPHAGRVRWYRLSGQQRRDLRRHETGLSAHRGRRVLPEVHERQPRWRAVVHTRGVQEDGQARRGRDRQPVLDRGVAVLQFLRSGESRGERVDSAAVPRTGRAEHPDQRDRTRADRHRSHQNHHSQGDGCRHRQGHPVEPDGHTRRSGRHVPVPAVRPGEVDHRADLQCRWRPDHPVVEELVMTDSDVKLGYIGLGNMGAPMAKRMVDWPGGLTVFDIRTEAMTPLAEAGARLADRVSDLAAADIISVTVLNDEQVREVVGELAGLAKPDTVIAIHSTISDTTAVELAKELQRQGIHVVDAPVSGGGGAAEKGELATMVGAEREVYERIKPVFKQWASMVIHAGEPGAGTRMKLARNMLTFTSYAAACEAMRLAEAAGLDLQALGRVVRHTDALTGGPGAIMVREDMKELTPGHWLYDAFTHTRGLGEKDLSLALALGDAIDVELPVAEVALKNLAAGLGVPHTVPTTKEGPWTN